jgi:hypothetical protein
MMHARAWTAASLALLFVPVSLTRYIDGDEGYLLYAARLVAEGKTLYQEFFFPQAPFVPTVFALLYKVVGSGWYSARALAGVMAALSGLLVFELARHYTKALRWGALAAFLYAACGYSIGWIPIAKTYGSAVLCSLAGVYVLERGGRYAALAGGFLIVLALEARLYVGIIGLNAILFILRKRAALPVILRELCLLAAGAALGLSLLVPPFVRDFESAFFGIFEFISIRFPEQTTLFGPVQQKLDTLWAELALVGSDGSGSIQLLGLVVLGLGAMLTPGLRRNRLTATVWPTLLFVNLLPYNTYIQYVCIVVPFVAVEAAIAVAPWASKPSTLRTLAPGLLMYAALGWLDLRRFTETGAGVIVVAQAPAAWSIEQVVHVGDAIDSYRVPEAISWWPGYFVSTQTHALPELANHFAFHVTGRLDTERRRRLTLMSEPELHVAITMTRYPLAVLGNWAGPGWLGALTTTYKVDRVVGNVSFWVPR